MNAPTGYTALDLVGFTDRGLYDGSATYVKNDIAEYGGKKWRCLVDDTTGVTPVEGVSWTVFFTVAADMTGATSSVAGTHGLVPAPAAGDDEKFLKGNGAWSDLTNIVTTTTDPGEGSALKNNTLLIVMEN